MLPLQGGTELLRTEVLGMNLENLLCVQSAVPWNALRLMTWTESGSEEQAALQRVGNAVGPSVI